MVYDKLQKAGYDFLGMYREKYGEAIAPPSEDECLTLFNKLSEREKYIVACLPVIVCDYEFDLPDELFMQTEETKH